MKKLWVSVKRGYIRDPKHRRAVGECTWLFQYMLDIADWNTGIISEWKDEAAAEDMEMPIRTLREQRRKLDELGYITCRQKQYGQDIVIHNWTNPRDYSGGVVNAKQGDRETELQENAQDDIQDDIQGSSQDVTPTYSSKNQISLGASAPSDMPLDWQLAHDKKINPVDQKKAQITDIANLIDTGAAGAGELALAFMEERGIVFTQSQVKGQRKAAREMQAAGVRPEHIRAAVRELVSKSLTCSDLYSVTKTAIDKANKPASTAPQYQTVKAQEQPDAVPSPYKRINGRIIKHDTR